MTEPAMPDSLRELVQDDLAPVRALRQPARRALVLVPVGLALLLGVPAMWGWRGDLSALDAFTAWGLSGLQSLAGLLVMAAALREAVPGRTLSGLELAMTVGTSTLLVLAVTLVTDAVEPTVESPAVWARFVWECFGVAAAVGFAVVLVAAWLVSRALPTRPGVAGALYGLGAGLMADAGIRLYCWVSSPFHVLVAHGGAIVVLAGAGAVMSIVIDRVRGRANARA